MDPEIFAFHQKEVRFDAANSPWLPTSTLRNKRGRSAGQVHIESDEFSLIKCHGEVVAYTSYHVIWYMLLLIENEVTMLHKVHHWYTP